MAKNPKNVNNVGGSRNADLIFQLAIDDNNENKDWLKIAQIVGEPVTPEKAQKWFEAVTDPKKKDRWTEKEESILHSLIFPKQELKNEQIYELFKNRSKKAVMNKISKIKKKKRSSLAINGLGGDPYLQLKKVEPNQRKK